MSYFIYADHAVTAAISDTVLQTMFPHLTTTHDNPSSLYRFTREGKTNLEQARTEIAAYLDARPEEIYFTFDGIEAGNWASWGVAEFMTLKGRKDDHIITSVTEHYAVLHTTRYLGEQGYGVTYLPVDGRGLVDPATLKGTIRPDTILISIMVVNNEIDTIEPIAGLGRITRAHEMLFHINAMQAMGHIPMDVKAWNVGLPSLSTHRFHGPKKVGALCMRKLLHLPAFIQSGDQEKGRRSDTENVPGAVGVVAALQKAMDGPSREFPHLAALRDRLIDGLTGFPYTRLIGDSINCLSGTAPFVSEGVEGEALLPHLGTRGIHASSGSACSSASLDPSCVLLTIGLPHTVAYGSLRLSLDAENTEADVDYILKEVPQVVVYLRELSPIWDRDAQKPTWEL